MRRLVPPVLVLSVAIVVPGVADRLPGLLAEMETFRVRRVTVEGTRFLPPAEVETALGIPGAASVWDDFTPWERAAESHPLVRSVDVSRRLPSTLVVRVEERVPVAFVATPTLEPVDVEGRVVPVDPAIHSVDLPILRVPSGRSRDAGVGGEDGTSPPTGADRDPDDGRARTVAPRPIQLLAAEVARLGGEDPSFTALVSEVAWLGGGDALARLSQPPVDLRYRLPLSVASARRAMAALADAAARRPGLPVASLDLRFADQVVVRYSGGGSP